VSDPLVGHLSDRTRSRLGRRRPWMLASLLPIFATLLMLWSPPERLEGVALTAWLAVAVIGFGTATTIFYVPYQSLGAELTPDYHERTRLFGAQQGTQLAGTLIAGVLQTVVMVHADEPREAARVVAVFLGLFVAGSIGLTTWKVRERAEPEGRGGRSLVAALQDVSRNRHARLLYAVLFVERMGLASLALVVPFYAKHVLEAAAYLPVFFVFFVVPGIALVPVIVKVSRRIGKLWLWRASLCAQAVGYLLLSILGPGDLWLACIFVTVVSFGSVSGQILAPSVQSDVIDYDELRTGERKEGTYFAVQTFVGKVGFGVGPLLVGVLFQLTGFDPQGEMGRQAIFGMRILIGVQPAVGALLGAFILLFFTLDEAEHARIRRALDG